MAGEYGFPESWGGDGAILSPAAEASSRNAPMAKLTGPPGSTKKKFQLQGGSAGQIPAMTASILARAVEAQGCRDREMEALSIQHDGGPASWSERFSPTPEGETQIDWEDIKDRLYVPANLVKAGVRSIRTAVMGASVRRTVLENPFSKIIDMSLKGRNPQKMRGFFENKITFGTGGNCPTLRAGRKVPAQWMPDPCYMHLYTDPMIVDEYVGMVEFSPDDEVIRFVTPECMGFLKRNVAPVVIQKWEDLPAGAESVVQICDFGFFPATIGFGEERTHRGQKYGISLVRELLKASIRASDCLLNASMLQKLQTRAILWFRNRIAQNPNDDNLADIYNKFVTLGENGEVGYATPKSNIADVLELFKAIMYVSGVNSGVPVDDLMPQAVQDASAEGARRRAVPITSLASEQMEMAVLDEQDIVLRRTALLEWQRTGKPVDLELMAEKVATDIVMRGTVVPVKDAERISNTGALMALGLITDDDAVLDFNDKKDQASRDAMVVDIETRRLAGTWQGTSSAIQEAVQEA